MTNDLKRLQEHAIDTELLNQIAERLQARAKKTGYSHPLSVYQSLSVDLALGALDTYQETSQNLGKSHSVKQWLDIIIGGQ